MLAVVELDEGSVQTFPAELVPAIVDFHVGVVKDLMEALSSSCRRSVVAELSQDLPWPCPRRRTRSLPSRLRSSKFPPHWSWPVYPSATLSLPDAGGVQSCRYHERDHMSRLKRDILVQKARTDMEK